MLVKIAWSTLLGVVAFLAFNAFVMRDYYLTAEAHKCSRHGDGVAAIRGCVDQEILRLFKSGCLKSVYPGERNTC
jgi:hypothetical protein